MMWTDWLNFRPITTWPGEMTHEFERARSPFSASLSATSSLLARELANLNALNPVLLVALRDRDIRLDGKPRADARPTHPGVIVAFNMVTRSKEFASRGHARARLEMLSEHPRARYLTPDELWRAAARRLHPDNLESGDKERYIVAKEAHRVLTQEDAFQFAVDKFATWQDNLRAIALGLEALRKVDRYGITKNSEQYTGWKQLEAGPAA
jgi:hypothetical protein